MGWAGGVSNILLILRSLFVEKQLDDERACGPLNCPHSEAYLLDRVGGSFKHVPPLGL